MAKFYKHILYATDLDSSHEKIVRNRVKSMYDTKKTKLSILHIIESMPVFMDMTGYLNIAEITDRMEVEAKSVLKKIGNDLEVSVNDQHVLVGSPKTDVVSFADKIKADLIILGGHNRHLIDNLIGSTTDAVVRSAHCDVLIVRYKED